MPSRQDFYSSDVYKRHKEINYPIVKGNRIVQCVHFTMPLVDQKVLASMIRSIKPNQKSLTVKFSASKFCKLLGVKKTRHRLAYVMGAVQRIDRDNFWIRQRDGSYVLWDWLQQAKVMPTDRNDGVFTITFNPFLRKYLLNKSRKYRTIYEFSEIMLMKNRYSPRLYEIFRSNMSRQKGKWLGLNYTVDELKFALNLMFRTKALPHKIKRDRHGRIKYRFTRFNDFYNRVLVPAVHEINRLTRYDINIKVVRGKRRQVKYLHVLMVKKNTERLIKRDDTVYFTVNHIKPKDQKHWKRSIAKQVREHAKHHDSFAKAHHLRKKSNGLYFVYDSATKNWGWMDKTQAKLTLKINRLQKNRIKKWNE